ncbi:hypothetical protein HOU43_gp50 [Cronobacter phage CS01]|uniref:Uncharacterized protein n=1 Tax=Cronobacter phage CS01 TaxID=2496544 RepID=A0A3B8DXI6_9CAUD|nr:hypothetical protein HOU43_gp50 [Cronobacter phage CS01]AYJ73338.1 hypothetical protein CS01_050 [Cronobacter phage CS01]
MKNKHLIHHDPVRVLQELIHNHLKFEGGAQHPPLWVYRSGMPALDKHMQAVNHAFNISFRRTG